jgi:uncharacterized protein (DUF433 family)
VLIPQIEVDEEGTARLAGTGFKVKFLGIAHRAGLTPAQMHEAHPHLTMAQIHAGLSYYFEHQAAMDQLIEDDRRYAEEMRAKAGPSPVAERLRREGFVK